MGWWGSPFGTTDDIPERRTHLQTGVFWQFGEVPALAAGRGLTQCVSGESFYRKELEEMTGGPTVHGVKIDCPALLIASEWNGEPAIIVGMGDAKVGSIPKLDAADLHDELLSVAPGGRATAKGRIEAGFEGGDYCVKLSLARPLRVLDPPRS